MKERFVCDECNAEWYGEYSFWNGYLSECPSCGHLCVAYKDSQVAKDIKSMYDSPLFEYEPERTEEDLEAERGEIREEIEEALEAADADTEADTDAE